MPAPKSLIINPPFHRPARYWMPVRDGTLEFVDGRRPASDDIIDLDRDTKRTDDARPRQSHPRARR